MKPEYEARRKIIREWMSLPKNKRENKEHATAFAKKATERIPSRRSLSADNGLAVTPHRQAMTVRHRRMIGSAKELAT
jgi:hypothetical protein